MSLEDDFRQIIRDKPASVVWVVGTGVPQGALRGTPFEPYTSWDGLLRSGLQRLYDLGKITAEELADHGRMLGHDNLNSWLGVAETVAQGLRAPGGGEFRRWLRETAGEFEKHIADRSVLDALADHQRRGGLLATTNYDLLLESVTGLQPVTWRSPADVERTLRGDEPQILHLHGAWRAPESIVLGIRSYDDVVRDLHARAVLTTFRTNYTFVFIGCGAGLRDPNLGTFLTWTANVFGGSEYRHFRLCRISELTTLRREHPDEQRIFPLSYGNDHAELAPFLRSLLPAPPTSAPSSSGSTSGPGVSAGPAAVDATAPVRITTSASTSGVGVGAAMIAPPPAKSCGPETARGSGRPMSTDQGPISTFKEIRRVLQDGYSSRADGPSASFLENGARSVGVGYLRKPDSSEHLAWIMQNQLHYAPVKRELRAPDFIAFYAPRSKYGAGALTHVAWVIAQENVKRSGISTPWPATHASDEDCFLYRLAHVEVLERPIENHSGRVKLTETSAAALTLASDTRELQARDPRTWWLRGQIRVRQESPRFNSGKMSVSAGIELEDGSFANLNDDQTVTILSPGGKKDNVSIEEFFAP